MSKCGREHCRVAQLVDSHRDTLVCDDGGGDDMALDIENKITTGNIITIAVMLVSAGMAYAQLTNSIASVAARTEALENVLNTRGALRDNAIAAQESRIRLIEVAQAAQSSDLRSIQVGIGRIETKLDRLEARP